VLGEGLHVVAGFSTCAAHHVTCQHRHVTTVCSACPADTVNLPNAARRHVGGTDCRPGCAPNTLACGQIGVDRIRREVLSQEVSETSAVSVGTAVAAEPATHDCPICRLLGQPQPPPWAVDQPEVEQGRVLPRLLVPLPPDRVAAHQYTSRAPPIGS
jgi:hypothetical protein